MSNVNDSLIEKLQAIKPSADSPEFSEHAYAQAIDDAIAIIRQHQAEQGDVDLRARVRQAFIMKGWPDKHTAGELADIAIAAMGEVEAGRGMQSLTGSSPIGLKDDNVASPALSSEISVIKKLENAKFEWKRLPILTAWEEGREAGFNQAFSIIQDYLRSDIETDIYARIGVTIWKWIKKYGSSMQFKQHTVDELVDRVAECMISSTEPVSSDFAHFECECGNKWTECTMLFKCSKCNPVSVSLEKCARAIVNCNDAYCGFSSGEKLLHYEKIKEAGFLLEVAEGDGFDALKLSKAALDAAGVKYRE